MTDRFIYPGRLWKDIAGKPIQAHGFSIFYRPDEKRWYWYGENKERTDGKGNIWHWGVRLYTSTDLVRWEDCGLIIPPEPDNLTSPLHPTYCMDRPHILYCTATGKYVAWLKIMVGEITQFMTVLTADRLEGPYAIVRRIYHPLNMNAGDFCLHADADGRAWIWFERPHFQMICATLTDDYTGLSGEYSVHCEGLRPPLTREAPAYFERNGRRYLITSGTTGYHPNRSRTYTFTDPHGEYEDLGDPHIGDLSATSFNSQISCVIQIPETDSFIACADRWLPQRRSFLCGRFIEKKYDRYFRSYTPDLAPQMAADLPERELRHGENTSISRYVWLPMEWHGDKPVIRWRRRWMPFISQEG